ncbi:MAG: hypothetical protein ACYS9C_11540 [Planctomycetota bacterium]
MQKSLVSGPSDSRRKTGLRGGPKALYSSVPHTISPPLLKNYKNPTGAETKIY